LVSLYLTNYLILEKGDQETKEALQAEQDKDKQLQDRNIEM
jgi:hypothetical protein